MAIKSILCLFGGSESELNAVNSALMFAKQYGAQVKFLHVSLDPSSYASRYGYGDCYAMPMLLEACEKENKERLDKTKRYITDFAEKYHIPLEDSDAEITHVSARLVHLTGRLDSIIAQEGRFCDLIVAGRINASALYDDAVIVALFNTGRPVMLLPMQKVGHLQETYKTIAVAWKNSQEAARAMASAMPFLESAEKVYVLTVKEQGESYDIEEEAALLAYLRTHNIHAQSITVTAGDHAPAEALLIRARELGAGLLVMGAYAHTRFREMILGGMTNHVLEKADIPLFLSH